jgi:hypothetical protein
MRGLLATAGRGHGDRDVVFPQRNFRQILLDRCDIQIVELEFRSLPASGKQ